jgi:hypothetical protein
MAFTVDDILLEWTNTDPKKGVSCQMDADLYEGYYTTIDAILFATSSQISTSLDAYLDPYYNFATWSRTDVIIPSASIDAGLTDFPLLINPSGSAGTTSADCTHFFESMRYPSFSKDDDFTGSDDDPPDSTLWTVSDPGGYISIQSNALQFSCPASTTATSYIESKFPIYDNFDVQIDFNITSYDPNYNATVMDMVGLRVLHSGNAEGEYSGAAVARGVSYTNDCLVFCSESADDAGPLSGWTSTYTGTTETAISTGKLRVMSFSGMILWALYSGGEWGWLYGDTWTPWTTEPRPWAGYMSAATDWDVVNDKHYGPYIIQVYFEQKSGHSTPLTVSVDNFTWNKPGNVNIYNMAILDENDEMLSAEVVDVETESGNEEMWLYTRVPSVSSSSDTTLRIYTTNDPDLAPNPCIGHQCQTASVQCWPDGLSVANGYGYGGDTAPERMAYVGLSYAIYPYHHYQFIRDPNVGLYGTGPYGGNPYNWSVIGATYLGPFGPASTYPDTMAEAFTVEFIVNMSTVPSSWCTFLGTGWDDGVIPSTNDQVGWTVRGDNEEVYLYFSPNGTTGYHIYFDWTPSADTDYHFMVVWETDQYPIVYVNGSALTRTTDTYIPTIFRPYGEWARLRHTVSSDSQFNYPTDGTKFSAIRVLTGAKSAAWHTATYEAQTDSLISFDVYLRQVGLDAILEIAGVSFSTTIAAESVVGAIDLQFIINFSATAAAASAANNIELDFIWSFTTTAAAASVTNDIALGLLLTFQVTSAAATVTADIALLNALNFVTGVAGASQTAPSAMAVLRELVIASAGASSTIDIGLLREMALAILAPAESVTSGIELDFIWEFSATAAATSLTGPIVTSVLRPVTSAVSVVTDLTLPPLLREISFGNQSTTWGEQSVTGGEFARSWTLWKTSAGAAVDVSGDSDWGVMAMESGDSNFGPVIFAGAGTHKFYANRDIYGTGQGSIDIYIRGQVAVFTQLAGSPTWELYTGPVAKTWSYVQVRVDD